MKKMSDSKKSPTFTGKLEIPKFLMPDDVEWQDSIWMQIIPPFDRHLKGTLSGLTSLVSDKEESPHDFLSRVLDAAVGWITDAAAADSSMTLFLTAITADLNERTRRSHVLAGSEKQVRSTIEHGDVYLVYTADGDTIFIRGDTHLRLIADCGLVFSWPPHHVKDATTLIPLTPSE
jgi:mRNA-degrading endonuclease YafQ of YafQ-DinJ toxin-antitoxin module